MKLAVHREHFLSRKRLLTLITLAVFASAGIFAITSIIRSINPSAHATLVGFDAGNIMDTAVMSNKGIMSESKIQSFLLSKNSCNDRPSNHPTITWTYKYNNTEVWAGGGTWRYYIDNNGYFICMAKQDFAGESAAHIIWQAAQDYNINPQVLIVLLQKEQGLVTDTYPNYNIQYKSATGYACPDTADCDKDYFGFKNQVRSAASLFRTVLSGGWTNYPVGNNYILYNPDRSCGGSTVNIRNLATSALYRYTPYQPNAAALAAGTGTAPCGAYGNRNFYNYFTDWFGSTRYLIQGSIGTYYYANDGANTLGMPIGNEYSTSFGHQQCFEKGCIAGTKGVYFQITGSIGKFYTNNRSLQPTLGAPVGNESKYSATERDYFQKFQNGYIAGRSTTGYWAISGSIGNTYSPADDYAALGIPIANESAVSYAYRGHTQCFDKGCILGSYESGYYKVDGSLYTFWTSNGGPTGNFGLPITSSTAFPNGNEMQVFNRGAIAGNTTDGYIAVSGSIGALYASSPETRTDLGLPVANGDKYPDTERDYFQKFQNGYISGRSATGYWAISGGIGQAYSPTDNPALGLPIGSEYRTSFGYQQCFERGCIAGAKGIYYQITGSIGAFYKNNPDMQSILGKPVGNESKYSSTARDYYQKFENGYIAGRSTTGYWVVSGSIGITYDPATDYTILGLPTGNESAVSYAYRGHTQCFDMGCILGSYKNGYWRLTGNINKTYQSLSDATKTKLGLPLQNELLNTANGKYEQHFQHGYISGISGSYKVIYN